MVEVNTQTAVFLQALLLGFALGMFYDVFRVLRLALRHSTTIVFLEDVFYFAVCAVLTFLFSLSAVSGRVRVFLVLGEFLGATVYYVTLGVLVLRISKTIIRVVKAIFRLLYRIFIRPFVRLARWLGRVLGKTEQKLCAKAKKVRTNAKYSLKRQSVLVYNLFVNKVKTKNGCCGGGMRNGKGRSRGAKNRKGAPS